MRRTSNEMRRGRGQTLPRNADASRMHTCAHGPCTDVVLSSFPSPSANNKLWYTILKRELVTHLRNKAQSNNVASNFVYTRCSDPPSNSGPHRKAPKVHPHWHQRDVDADASSGAQDKEASPGEASSQGDTAVGKDTRRETKLSIAEKKCLRHKQHQRPRIIQSCESSGMTIVENSTESSRMMK